MTASLLAAAQRLDDWARRSLADLVSCESPSSDVAALNECADLVAELGAKVLGRPPRREPGRPHLHWPADGPRPVLLLGHFDTVWPKGTLTDWPYTVTDDIATGPGVFDMKAGIIQMFLALSLLPDHSNVEVLLTSDEELGSPTSRELVESVAARARAVLVGEPSEEGKLKTARKGASMYVVRLAGRAAHAGLHPARGINATIEAAHQVLAIADLAAPEADTTVTPTVLTSGETLNTVPDAAELSVDARAWTAAEQRRVDEAIRSLRPRLPGAAITVTGGINRPPLEPAASRDLAAAARLCAADLGIAGPGEAAVGGASDGNLTAALGVPTLDGLGAVGGHAHAAGEYADLRAVPERAALLAALIGRIPAT